MRKRRIRRLWLGLGLTSAAMVTSVSLWLVTRDSERARVETAAYETRVDAAQEIDDGLSIVADRRESLQSHEVNPRLEAVAWRLALDSLQHGAAYLTTPSPEHDGVAAALARAHVIPLLLLADSVVGFLDSTRVGDARQMVNSRRFTQAEQQLRRALATFAVDERRQQRERLTFEGRRQNRMRSLAVLVASTSLLLLVALIAQLYLERGRRSEAELQSRVRDQQMQIAFRAGQMGWWSWDPETQIREWSAEMGPLYGQAPGWSPPPGDSIVQMHPDDIPAVLAARNAAFQAGGGSVPPYRIVWPDGTVRWMEAEIVMDYSVGVRPRAMGVVRDVTSAHEAFAERDRLARRMAELLEGLGSGVVLREGPELLPSLMNPAARRMLGITDETYPDYVFGARRIEPLDEYGQPVPFSDIAPARARATGSTQFATYQIRRADGSNAWHFITASPLGAAAGVEAPVLVSIVDVTNEREMEIQLRDSEARYRTVIDSMTEGVVVQDTRGNLLSWNERAEEIMGLTRSQLEGRNARDPMWQMEGEHGEIIPPELRPGAIAARERRSVTREIALRSDTGDVRWVRTSAAPLTRSDATDPWGVVLVLTDITERRMLDEHLRQTSKLQAVGTLAGGIAHDFNNLLTVIRGSAELLRHVDAETTETEVAAIVNAADRGQALTRQLLTFTRQNVEQPAVWELDALLGDSLPLLTRVMQKDQQLLTSLRAPGVGVMLDRPSFELALLNIVANARDASGAAGVVQLRSALVAKHDRRRPPVLAGVAVIRIDIEDNGPGFNSDALEHLFEPFFTTKTAGNGTGLGLATAHRVVHAAGGTITIGNQNGGGALVSIWMPIASTPEPQPDIALASASTATPRGTVLVVEDELAVRQLTERALGHLGYAVITAPSGADALNVLANPSTHIDYVLTDFAMPGMTGAQFLEMAEARGLSRPSVLMSGYTADESVRELMGALGTRFLAKPFSLQSLSESLAGLGDEVEA